LTKGVSFLCYHQQFANTHKKSSQITNKHAITASHVITTAKQTMTHQISPGNMILCAGFLETDLPPCGGYSFFFSLVDSPLPTIVEEDLEDIEDEQGEEEFFDAKEDLEGIEDEQDEDVFYDAKEDLEDMEDGDEEEVYHDAKEYEYEVASRCSTNNSVRRRRPPKRTTFILVIQPLPAIAEEEEEEEPAERDEEHDEDEFFDADQYEEQDDEFYDAKEYEYAFEAQVQVQQNNNSNSMPREQKPLASIDEEHVWYTCNSKKISIYLVAEEPLGDEEQGEPLSRPITVQLHETIKMFDVSLPLATIPEEPDEIINEEPEKIINEEQDEIPLYYVTDSESNDEDRDDDEQDQDQEQGAPLLPSPPQQLRRRSLRIAANTSVPTLSPPTLPLLRRSPRLAHMPRVSYVGMC
jgi:hypothetical protein